MLEKIKDWVQTNVPMLTKIYDNKYVSMLVDRFQSLPNTTQKNFFTGGILILGVVVFGYLGSLFISLWQEYDELASLKNRIQSCLHFQKTYETKASDLTSAEKDNFGGKRDPIPTRKIPASPDI